MKTGPKYKIARRLGAPIFEKTQSPKFTLSLARKEKSRKRTRPKSEFGLSLIEKQKARLTYGILERQFKGYVEKAMKSSNPTQKLYSLLEKRLDNILYRAGILRTRAQARQAAAHGHLMVNGRRVTIPSISLVSGDSVSIRPGSRDSRLFADSAERIKSLTVSPWIEVDGEKLEVKVVGEPVYDPATEHFDLGVVVEFYNR